MIAYQKEDGRVSVPEKNAPIGKRLIKKTYVFTYTLLGSVGMLLKRNKRTQITT